MSPVRRKIAVELPEELRTAGEDNVGVLQRAVCGTRDAATCWEAEVADMMGSIGFTRGRATPCNYFHDKLELRVTVHGDDFCTLGVPEDLKWFATQLKTRWTITERGMLGPPSLEGTTQSIRRLNRLIEWTADGITWEPDPRHAELIVKSLNITTGTAVTPLAKSGSRRKDEDDPFIEDGEEQLLEGEDVTTYRSTTMRMSYLSQDRTDLQRVVRELAKGMKKPTQGDWQTLKRAGRYILKYPRVVQVIKFHPSFGHLQTYCDTDHAGCIKTRKSTTGLVLMLGGAMVRSLCRGQAVIALSSGEAEFYGLVSAASESLGERSILQEWGISVPIRIMMDATAGAAIGSRRGIGRVKHLDTAFLWVQDYVTTGRITIKKVHTSVNLADLLTKPTTGVLLWRVMEALHYQTMQGRSAQGYTA